MPSLQAAIAEASHTISLNCGYTGKPRLAVSVQRSAVSSKNESVGRFVELV
ncbi:MAG: hypothetical protein KME42_06960 [Tildeniella nuda ZEHNDER 1965/U140]|nr:hypothetical protein [Tildeniella nuda ZEHNDER 1965/U140]